MRLKSDSKRQSLWRCLSAPLNTDGGAKRNFASQGPNQSILKLVLSSVLSLIASQAQPPLLVPRSVDKDLIQGIHSGRNVLDLEEEHMMDAWMDGWMDGWTDGLMAG